MFKVMQQYGTAAQPATVYYCDDEADLQNIKSAPMGAQALVIHLQLGKDFQHYQCDCERHRVCGS